MWILVSKKNVKSGYQNFLKTCRHYCSYIFKDETIGWIPSVIRATLINPGQGELQSRQDFLLLLLMWANVCQVSSVDNFLMLFTCCSAVCLSTRLSSQIWGLMVPPQKTSRHCLHFPRWWWGIPPSSSSSSLFFSPEFRFLCLGLGFRI